MPAALRPFVRQIPWHREQGNCGYPSAGTRGQNHPGSLRPARPPRFIERSPQAARLSAPSHRPAAILAGLLSESPTSPATSRNYGVGAWFESRAAHQVASPYRGLAGRGSRWTPLGLLASIGFVAEGQLLQRRFGTDLLLPKHASSSRRRGEARGVGEDALAKTASVPDPLLASLFSGHPSSSRESGIARNCRSIRSRSLVVRERWMATFMPARFQRIRSTH